MAQRADRYSRVRERERERERESWERSKVGHNEMLELQGRSKRRRRCESQRRLHRRLDVCIVKPHKYLTLKDTQSWRKFADFSIFVAHLWLESSIKLDRLMTC